MVLNKAAHKYTWHKITHQTKKQNSAQSYTNNEGHITPNEYNAKNRIKYKAIAVTGLEGLYGCEMSRTAHCLNRQFIIGGSVVSLARRPRFNPSLLLFRTKIGVRQLLGVCINVQLT
jgi:hypothetical protein